ncbi:MAG: 1-phosphofructokinase, partial [Clostridia bacterium]|nr:1-phosphofructokinase [Clostridia bacterium]
MYTAMIYTVTFNPSLDYYLKVNNLKSGSVNRTASERLTVGGKGVNISLELKKLGDESVALGFVAGFTGQEILREIEKTGISHDFIEVDGRSRINVKIKSTAETDINGAGAIISAADVEKLTARLKEKLKEGDFVLICGNAPAYLGNDVYADIISELKKINGVNFVVDACGKLLTNTLKYKPFLIKPNYYELC